MDHISEALKKAKEEQGSSVRSWVNPSVAGPVSAPPRGELQAARVPRLHDLQTTPIDLELMARSNMLCEPEKENPIMADHYRVLRTRVKQKMGMMGWTKLGITSPSPLSGKTFTAINLALTMARAAGDDVVLVDCDARNPSVGKGVGIEREVGIVDYLRGDAALEEVMLTVEQLPNLHIVPGRVVQRTHGYIEAMTGPKMQSLFDILQQQSPNAFVIVDLPPVVIGDEVLGLAPSLDAFVMIVRDGLTNLDTLATAMDMLKDYEVLGTVLNDCEENLRNYAGYAYGN